MSASIYKEEIKEALKEMFASGEIRIEGNIYPEYAQAGDGKWNTLYLNVLIDNETVYKTTGNVDLIEPR